MTHDLRPGDSLSVDVPDGIANRLGRVPAAMRELQPAIRPGRHGTPADGLARSDVVSAGSAR